MGECGQAGGMGQHEPVGIQQGQMPSPATRTAGTKLLQWYMVRIDWLDSNTAEKELGVVVKNRLRVSQ